VRRDSAFGPYTSEPLEDAAARQEKGAGASHPSAVFTRIAWLLIIFGIVLRLGQYIANRSLWLDESVLALSIAGRSFRGLLEPLDYSQIAPIGFVMLEKLAVKLFGTNEYALRLVPITAGIGSVLLFYRVAKQCLNERALLVAMCLFCASEPLIYYASEVKQYSSDVLVAVAILWPTIRSLQQGLVARRYVGLALIGAVAVWFSYPAVFILAGSGIALAAREAWEGRRRSMYKVLAVASIWALSFAINYRLFGKGNDAMVNYWEWAFAPVPTSGEGLLWYFKAAFRSMRDLFGPPSALPDLGPALSGLALVAALAGIGSFFEIRRWILAALLIPVALTLFASALKLYPFAGRTALFLDSIFILLVAAGAQERPLNARKSTRIANFATAVLVLAPMAAATVGLIKRPGHQETRAVLNHLGERSRAGDLVYMYPGFQPSVEYYSRFSKIVGLSELEFLEGDPAQWPTFDGELRRLRGHSRVWIFFCHTKGERGLDDQAVLLSVLDQKGKRLDEFNATGASTYLYDLSLPGGSDGR